MADGRQSWRRKRVKSSRKLISGAVVAGDEPVALHSTWGQARVKWHEAFVGVKACIDGEHVSRCRVRKYNRPLEADEMSSVRAKGRRA